MTEWPFKFKHPDIPQKVFDIFWKLLGTVIQHKMSIGYQNFPHYYKSAMVVNWRLFLESLPISLAIKIPITEQYCT